jgi:hypothetical protein
LTTRVDQNAFLLLANIIGEGLLSAEELNQFSQEAQARIKMIQELLNSFINFSSQSHLRR